MASISHDQNFKNLILDYPRDSLAFFAAEEAPAPDDDVDITPVRQEQLKERLGDRFRELDTPLLVFRPGNKFAKPFDLGEDGLCGRDPDEGGCPAVVVFDEGVDAVGELLDAGEGAAADGLLGDDAEPALDLVEPGGVGGREVQVVSGPAGEPVLDLGVAVGGVVVDDQVDVEVLRHAGVDVAEEGEELLVAVSLAAPGDHLAGGDVEGGEQGGGAVADVVVGDALDVSEPHGQHRLGAVERLHLALLVDAQHQGVVRRVEVQADDVAHLVDEEGVAGELEGFAAVRLQSEGAPDTVDSGGAWPTARAMERRLQWVASVGVSSKVRRTTSVMSSSLIRLGVPGRGSS